MFSRILLSRSNLLEDLCTWAVMITHYSKHEVKPKYGRTIKAKALKIYLKERGMGVTKFAHQVFHVLLFSNDEK